MTVTAIWCAWGLFALVRPSVLQTYFERSFRYCPPLIVFRLLAVPVFLVGAVFALFVVTASPGRIY